jgi:SAM-dependent methyltransferase
MTRGMTSQGQMALRRRAVGIAPEGRSSVMAVQSTCAARPQQCPARLPRQLGPDCCIVLCKGPQSACQSNGVTLVFDRAYYQKFYFDPRTAVTTQAEMRARAQLIAAYAGHVGLPVRRMLDAGCGTGMLRKPLEKAFPKARYVGLDVSEYLCERFGWELGTVDTWRSNISFDLVICYDVIQYLDDRRAARAVTNLGRLCRAVLYFGALTTLDWRENCDRRRTDAEVHMRTGAWYRARLRRYFTEIGAGFWLRRGAPLTVWELETAG